MTTDTSATQQGTTTPTGTAGPPAPPATTELERLWATNRRLGRLLVAGDGTGDLERATTASTERLDAQAEQWTLWTEGRADRAAADRLTQQYEAIREARSNRAATERLDALAEAFERGRRARVDRAATERLTAQADAFLGR